MNNGIIRLILKVFLNLYSNSEVALITVFYHIGKIQIFSFKSFYDFKKRLFFGFLEEETICKLFFKVKAFKSVFFTFFAILEVCPPEVFRQ